MPQPAKTISAVWLPLSEKRSGRNSFSGWSLISFAAGSDAPSFFSGMRNDISALSTST